MPRRSRRAITALLCVLLFGTTLAAQALNQALEVGDDSVLRVPAHPSLEPTTALTIECWIKARGSIEHGRIVRKSGDFRPGYHLSFSYQAPRVSTDLYMQGNSYLAQDTVSNSTYLGAWHHLACTVVAGAQMHLYIDGALVASRTAPPVLQHSDALVIGGMFVNAVNVHEEFLGLIDEVRFWNVARTREQIAADRFHHVFAGAGLVSTWHFDEDTRDAVGANHGTLVGAARLVPSDSPVSRNLVLSSQQGPWIGGGTVDLRGPFPPGLLPNEVYFGEQLSPSFSYVAVDVLRAVVPRGFAGEDTLVRARFATYDLFGTSLYRFLPRLELPATARIGTSISLRLAIPPPGHTVLFAGLPPAIRVSLPLFDGVLGIQPPFVEILSTPVPFSSLELIVPIPPDPLFVDLELLVQALFATASNPSIGTFMNLELIRITS